MNQNKEKLLDEIQVIEKTLEKKYSIQFVNKVREDFGFSWVVPIKASDYKKYLVSNFI